MPNNYVDKGYWEYGYAVGDILDVSVSITGVQLTATAGTLSVEIKGSKGSTVRRKKKHPYFLPFNPIPISFDTSKSATVTLSTKYIVSNAGKLTAIGDIHINGNVSISIERNMQSVIDKMNIKTIINPSDDELMYLFSI